MVVSLVIEPLFLLDISRYTEVLHVAPVSLDLDVSSCLMEAADAKPTWSQNDRNVTTRYHLLSERKLVHVYLLRCI